MINNILKLQINLFLIYFLKMQRRVPSRIGTRRKQSTGRVGFDNMKREDRL